jgi:hypothetical protein
VNSRHQASGLQVGGGAQPEEEARQQRPRQSTPVEKEALPEDLLLPRPAAILQVVLADYFDRGSVIRPSHQQTPAAAVRVLVNGRLNSLADEHKAPVHCLAV